MGAQSRGRLSLTKIHGIFRSPQEKICVMKTLSPFSDLLLPMRFNKHTLWHAPGTGCFDMKSTEHFNM